MRSYTRHQLKENAFAETTAETISWAVEHRSKLIAAPSLWSPSWPRPLLGIWAL